MRGIREQGSGVRWAAYVCLGLILAGVLGVCDAWGQKELRVAAAADLQPVMPQWAAAYEHATGVKLVVSYGSSSMLAEQILNGAPMDIFLGADFTFPEKIVAAGLADGTTPTAYAKGTLVVWARKDSPLQPLSVEKLVDPQVKTIAIANELHAPYGRAAAAALQKMKMYDAAKPHFVEAGNAQIGLISLTAASSPHFKDVGSYVLVPTSQYPPILQYAVVMAKSERKAEAHAFLDWVLSPAVQE